MRGTYWATANPLSFWDTTNAQLWDIKEVSMMNILYYPKIRGSREQSHGRPLVYDNQYLDYNNGKNPTIDFNYLNKK